MGLGLALAAGSLLGAGTSLFQNKASAKQAKIQMDFQERMSNTAYQRAVNDMRQAGLNPVLAAGSPASTPGGAMGQTANMSEAVAKGATTALALKQGSALVRQAEATATKGEYDAWLSQEMKDYWEANPAMHSEIMRSMWHHKAGQGQIGAMGAYIGDAAGQTANRLADKVKRGYQSMSERSRSVGGDVINSAKRSYESLRRAYEETMYDPQQRIQRNAGRVINPYYKKK